MNLCKKKWKTLQQKVAEIISKLGSSNLQQQPSQQPCEIFQKYTKT